MTLRTIPIDADRTDFVKDWFEGVNPNYGFVLIGDTQIGVVNLWAKEASVEENRPKLVVTYKVPSIDVEETPLSMLVLSYLNNPVS